MKSLPGLLRAKGGSNSQPLQITHADGCPCACTCFQRLACACTGADMDRVIHIVLGMVRQGGEEDTPGLPPAA